MTNEIKNCALIGLIVLNCLLFSNAKPPSPEAGSSSIESLLPAFNDTSERMSLEDRKKLDEMVSNVIGYYSTTLNSLGQKFSLRSSLKNMVESGRNLCLAAYSMAKSVPMSPKFPVDDEFFQMAATVGSNISTRANELIVSKGYTKSNVDKTSLKFRATNLLAYIQTIINTSPFGLYLQWNKMNDITESIIPIQAADIYEEMADVLAQLRAVDLLHEMNTIQRLFNQMRKHNKKALEKASKKHKSSNPSSSANEESSGQNKEDDIEDDVTCNLTQ